MKIKIKKIVIKGLLGLMLMLSLSASIGANAAHAAPPAGATCKEIDAGNKGTAVDGGCQYTGEVCPGGWLEVKKDAGKITCKEAAKSGGYGGASTVEKMKTLLWLQAAINKLIWPILVLIGGLMDNDLLFGHGMEERLREIWIIIRNLVNILFVIVLVGIALYNILGLGDDSGNYAIKSILPKIVVALIAINFSFLGIKVLLDGINVLTTSIFALPDQVNEGLSQILTTDESKQSAEDKEKVNRLCKLIRGLSSAEAESMTKEQITKQAEESIKRLIAKKNGITANDIAGIDKQLDEKPQLKAKFDKEFQAAKEGQMCDGLKLSVQGEKFLRKYNSRNAAFAMALNMSNIIFYEDVDFSSLSKGIEHLATNALFSMVFYLVFAASFLALFVVLLARLVVMWLSIALSPLLLLAMAEPTLKEKLGGFNKLAEQFTKMALAPLVIALSMSIGWIMLKAIQGISSFQKDSGLFVASNLGFPVVGLSTIQDIVVAMSCIGVVWLGVFGAAEGTFAEKAVGFIKESAQKAATWVGTLPLKHTPILPIQVPGAPAGQKYSLAEAKYALGEAFSKDSTPQTRLWEDITGKKPVTHMTVFDQERVKDKGDFYKWLNSSKAKLGDADHVDSLKNLPTERKDIWEGLPKEVQDQIKKVIGDPSKENIEALYKMDGIARAGLLPEVSKGQSTDDDTPKPPSKPVPPTDDTTFGAGKKPAKDLVPAADKDKAFKAYKDNLEKLSGNLEKWEKSKPNGDIAAGEKTKLENDLKANFKIGTTPATPDDLKTQLGDTRYGYLTKALGGGDATKGEEALKALLTPPATPGAAPAATPAGTGGGPAGGAPAAGGAAGPPAP